MSESFKHWGPYLSYGIHPSTEMIISWRDGKKERTGWVKFGKDQDCKNKQEENLVMPVPDSPSLSPTHAVLLKDLEPATLYYYRTSKDPDKIYHFKTGLPPGSKEPFEFTVNGDMHAHPCNSLKVYFDLMEEMAPNHDFFVGVGDFIGNGEDDTHWNSYFHDAKDYLPWKPQMNATGNHDTNNKKKYRKYLETWTHRYVDPKKGAYYLMEYGNAVFFFIDSDNAGGWAPTPGDEQLEWLEENLEKHSKKDKWIFIFMHHQIYSTGDFGCEPIMHELLRPLFQEHHVDAVFYGHDHHYEAFWVDRDEEWGGTLYFVTGGGGGQHHIDYSIMGDRNGRTIYKWPGRFFNVRKHGIPPLVPNAIERARWCRNDELVKSCQMIGVLEPNFVHIRIEGDLMELKSIGWQKQVYHHIKVRRAGAGRKYDPKCELELIDY
ncbi:MAG: metallophosphoesterase [Promethearchaeota archaeon]